MVETFIDIDIVYGSSDSHNCAVYSKYVLQNSSGRRAWAAVSKVSWYFFACSNTDCSIDDITITFVREGKPKKLLSFFKNKGYNISEYEKGIYHVLKQDHIDIQIVVTGEINDDYLWLKALTDKLTLEDAIRLIQAAKNETDIEGMKRISSILDLTSRLNADKDWMKEAKNMQAFRYLFEDEFKEKDKTIENLKELLKQNKIAMF